MIWQAGVIERPRCISGSEQLALLVIYSALIICKKALTPSSPESSDLSLQKKGGAAPIDRLPIF
jgi:hypothetical protein